MSSTRVSTTVHVGDDPPTTRTFPIGPPHPFATVDLADITLIIRNADQAHALIGALREAVRFFLPTDPDDLRTTTEAEADRNAAESRALVTVLPGKVAL